MPPGAVRRHVFRRGTAEAARPEAPVTDTAATVPAECDWEDEATTDACDDWVCAVCEARVTPRDEPTDGSSPPEGWLELTISRKGGQDLQREYCCEAHLHEDLARPLPALEPWPPSSWEEPRPSSVRHRLVGLGWWSAIAALAVIFLLGCLTTLGLLAKFL